YQENAQRILNLSYRMVREEQTARDLAQEVWIKVYQNLGRFEGKSAVSTWLYRITVNHILNYFKREKKRRWREVLNLNVKEGWQGEFPDYDNFSTGEDTPEEKLQQKDRESVVWQAIQQLPENQRIPLLLFRYEDRNYKEISEILGLSINAVESRLHRARKKLQKLLEPYLNKI
ncbi:MAG: sigma-70 family RNA polymerase sigma factor, partial [Calditrichia bacterium]